MRIKKMTGSGKNDGSPDKQAGFSLIELAVLMSILSLIMVGLVQTYRVHVRKMQIENTNARKTELVSALMLYLFENKHLPCPSARGRAQDDPEYGRLSCAVYTPGAGFWSLPTCQNGLCRVAGQRDVDQNGTLDGAPGSITPPAGLGGNSNLSAVLIGSVPFKELNTALNLSRQNIFDGWGRQFTYAVAERLTRPEGHPDEGYNKFAGTIGYRIWKPLAGAEGDPTQDLFQQNTSPDDSLNAILLSHGPDGMGAYTSNGALVSTCLSGGSATRDSENCNDDSIFSTVETSGNTTLKAHAPGPYHFDDIVTGNFEHKSFHWQTSSIDPDNIQTTIASFVGIGEDAPDAVVDVAGNIRIGDSGVSADLRTNELCNQATGDCFNPQLIGGTGMSCPNSGQVMVGVANGAPVCQYAAMSGVNPGTCPGGQFIVGFNASGDIICAAP